MINVNNQKKSKIRRFKVQHPRLQKFIKFFWILQIEQIELNHKFIPQRNINMRINLSSTPHCVCRGSDEKILNDVYFMGLQTHDTNSYLKLNGNVDIIGICFMPYGFFPFLKIPVSEYKNQILEADEIGFKLTKKIAERLKESKNIYDRLTILEVELLTLLDDSNQNLDKFQLIFNALNNENPFQLNNFCIRRNINMRQLERLYLKYIGLSPKIYSTLDRFHCVVNQLLNAKNIKLSNLAYDYEYYDQMHFIKDFKRYAGNTPKIFINQENSILQIGKLI